MNKVFSEIYKKTKSYQNLMKLQAETQSPISFNLCSHAIIKTLATELSFSVLHLALHSYTPHFCASVSIPSCFFHSRLNIKIKFKSVIIRSWMVLSFDQSSLKSGRQQWWAAVVSGPRIIRLSNLPIQTLNTGRVAMGTIFTVIGMTQQGIRPTTYMFQGFWINAD